MRDAEGADRASHARRRGSAAIATLFMGIGQEDKERPDFWRTDQRRLVGDRFSWSPRTASTLLIAEPSSLQL